MNKLIEGTITDVKHSGTSRMGNPTYRVTLDTRFSALTVTDGSIGYAATNYEPHPREAMPRLNTLHINGRGRIENITGPTSRDALDAQGS